MVKIFTKNLAGYVRYFLRDSKRRKQVILLSCALSIIIGVCSIYNTGLLDEGKNMRKFRSQELHVISSASDGDYTFLENALPELRSHPKFTTAPSKINVKIQRSSMFHDPNLVDEFTSVVIVKSNIPYRDRRDAIRETWGALKYIDGARLETIFIVGSTDNEKFQTQIQEESEMFGDILQTNIPETRENLPLKVLAGMWWASSYLPSDWLVSSADDDMLLHPTNFIEYINKIAKVKIGNKTSSLTLQYETLPIICFYSYRVYDMPVREVSNKWRIPETDYPLKYWPPYCRGGWYTMPVMTAMKLYNVSRTMRTLFLDDVWITGLMRIKLLSLEEKKPLTPGYILRETGLIDAPLARRSNTELYHRENEQDLRNVIVSHLWGDFDWFRYAIAKSILKEWKRWFLVIEKRMRFFVTE